MVAQASQPTVLIAPLNWGWGHATRMVPIIYEAHAVGFRVVILTSRPLIGFFTQTCPFAKIIDDGLAPISWSVSRVGFGSYVRLALHMSKQRFKEHQLLRKLQVELNLRLIISDNRYGIYLKQVRSLFVTHQFAVKLPAYLSLLEPLFNRCLRLLYRRFDHIWLPDSLEHPLAGNLSMPAKNWASARFIGPLSRYMFVEEDSFPHPVDVLVLLSGPEPARTSWCTKLESLFRAGDYVVCFALATEDGNRDLISKGPFYYLHNGRSEEIKGLLKDTPRVIARSGYSTLMDLTVMGKGALLVPTPGQSEQLYLAQWLSNHPLFVFVEEDELTLAIIHHIKEQRPTPTAKVPVPFHWKDYLKRECEKHGYKS